MPSRMALVLLTALALAACSSTYTSSLAGGTFAVTYATHALTVAKVPIEREVVHQDGYDFVTELQHVDYAFSGPFHDAQSIATLREAHGQPIAFDGAQLASLETAMRDAITKRWSAEGVSVSCANAVPLAEDAPAGSTGWSMTCQSAAGGTRQTLVVRVLTMGGVLFIQGGSWTDERGRELVAQFFRSLRATAPRAAQGEPVRVKAEVIANVLDRGG